MMQLTGDPTDDLRLLAETRSCDAHYATGRQNNPFCTSSRLLRLPQWLSVPGGYRRVRFLLSVLCVSRALHADLCR